eukprot:1482642-Lingulodinium_polyedra.AAC.1
MVTHRNQRKFIEYCKSRLEVLFELLSDLGHMCEYAASHHDPHASPTCSPVASPEASSPLGKRM